MLFYHVISNKEPTIEHKNKTDFLLKIYECKQPSMDPIPPKFRPFIRSLWDKDPEKRPTFDQIITKLLQSRSECWLDDVDQDEIERYIHQFGATLKTRNQSEYIDIINRVNDKLPANISRSIKHLDASTLSSNQNVIIELAKNLYKNASNEPLLKMSIELANIAADLNSTDAFLLLGHAHKDGRGVRKNIAIAAVHFKVAADCGDVNGMFEYASILMIFFTKTINDRKMILKEAKEIISNLDGKNSYFYEESRHCFDTIENREASHYISRKYFEKASNKGHQKSKHELKNMNQNQFDISFPLPYFEEFCQDITDKVLNKQ